MQFSPGTTPVAVEFGVVPKLNHLVILIMSWFAEFNAQIDWYNRFASFNLEAEKYTVVAISSVGSFLGIDLCKAD